MQSKVSDGARHEMSTVGADTPVRRDIEDLLRRRMWIHPEQVRVAVRDGVATLTGTVDRRSTAGIAAMLTTDVPGVSRVVNRIRFDFDDTDLVRSKVSRTHPFSADPFPPAGKRRRRRKPGRRMPDKVASAG
ncbi:BON domain-containing protein [Krasilnikovia sp. M28-CT-15]|uniref:BON domain-containing protein n=1 Tax=Krasilnikovia sp. M28-CT-15 TaxID=3373540 RepID=UPI0038769E20